MPCNSSFQEMFSALSLAERVGCDFLDLLVPKPSGVKHSPLGLLLIGWKALKTNLAAAATLAFRAWFLNSGLAIFNYQRVCDL